MRLLLLLALVLAVPASAQTASMDVGPQALDLRYRSGGADALGIDYVGTVTSVGFYGSTAAFSGFYGSQTRLGEPGTVRSLSAYGFDVTVGGNVPVVRFGQGTTVSAYVPIRAQWGSRYLSGDQSSEIDGHDTAILLGDGALGAGLGAALDVPLGAGAPARTIHTFGTAVMGAGIQGGYAMAFPGTDPDPGAYGLRSARLMVQTEAHGLFGSNLGASIGYTFRAVDLDASPIESVGGAFNAVTGSDFRRAETSHLVRVGLIF